MTVKVALQTRKGKKIRKLIYIDTNYLHSKKQEKVKDQKSALVHKIERKKYFTFNGFKIYLMQGMKSASLGMSVPMNCVFSCPGKLVQSDPSLTLSSPSPSPDEKHVFRHYYSRKIASYPVLGKCSAEPPTSI